MSVKPVPRPRMTATARRAEVVEAASAEFAMRGYEGATTEAIARRAGVSQPYVVRLFGTKKALFSACCQANFDLVTETFTRAAEGLPADRRLAAMGDAYGDLLNDRERLLMQLQGYAATGDPEIRALMRDRYAALYRYVEKLSGATPAELRTFFAIGMLCNVAAALELPEIMGSWPKADAAPPPYGAAR